MLSSALFESGIREVLFIGAHCDDIEIGCGGTALRLARLRPDIRMRWVVFSGNDTREAETRHAAELLLAGVHDWQVKVERFRNGYFPFVASDIKDCFEAMKSEVDPDIVFSHYRGDAHQDHRLLAELTWNTFRDHLVLEYEIPKYDGDLGRPNAFVELSDEEHDRKIDVLMSSFVSQQSKKWFDPGTFTALMRLRGMEIQATYAEAFFARKLRL